MVKYTNAIQLPLLATGSVRCLGTCLPTTIELSLAIYPIPHRSTDRVEELSRYSTINIANMWMLWRGGINSEIIVTKEWVVHY